MQTKQLRVHEMENKQLRGYDNATLSDQIPLIDMTSQ